MALLGTLIGPGNVVVDVGAHIGCHSLFFARCVGSNGHVHAFEPQRILFQTLCGNMAINSLQNVTCHPFALGAQPGTGSMQPVDYLASHNAGMAQVQAGSDDTRRRTRAHAGQHVAVTVRPDQDRRRGDGAERARRRRRSRSQIFAPISMPRITSRGNPARCWNSFAAIRTDLQAPGTVLQSRTISSATPTAISSTTWNRTFCACRPSESRRFLRPAISTSCEWCVRTIGVSRGLF